MNIQANKENLAARTIMMDASDMKARKKMEIMLPSFGDKESLSREAGRKLLANAAIQSIGQVQAVRTNEMKKRNEQAMSDAAVQKAEGEGMEKAQAQQDEQERLAQAEKAKQKRTFTLPVPAKKSHFVRNALVIGGISTATIVGGVTMFPVFFGNT